MWNKKNEKCAGKPASEGEAGFTLVEAVAAILIITIGLIGTAAAITYALEFSAISKNVTAAKSHSVAILEEIDSLRNSRRLDFQQIANVGSVDNNGSPNPFNGFSVGMKPVSKDPGPDGVFGTDDDLRNAGTDNVFGTADDFDDPTKVRSGFFRQITITNLNDSLKRIEVKIRYLGAGGKVGEITGVSYLDNEAHITR